jgi:hypothetical protein
MASNIEANLVGKKAGQDKIGHFTRLIQGKLPFRQGYGSGGIAAE